MPSPSTIVERAPATATRPPAPSGERPTDDGALDGAGPPDLDGTASTHDDQTAAEPVRQGGPSTARTGAPIGEPETTAMFDSLAPIYDRMNTLMTLGADGRWRSRACRATAVSVGDAALDVCCGTGKLAVLLAEQVGPFGRVEALDLSSEMVERATTRYHGLVQLRFQVANALRLPFEDDEFDAATISFGLRNLVDFEAGFRELARVVKPGGHVVCLELSLPRSRVWARLYHALFRRMAPLAARVLGAPRSAYRYLPSSLDEFPSAEQLAASMRAAGLVEVRFWRLSTGIVALHRATVPGQPESGPED